MNYCDTCSKKNTAECLECRSWDGVPDKYEKADTICCSGKAMQMREALIERLMKEKRKVLVLRVNRNEMCQAYNVMSLLLYRKYRGKYYADTVVNAIYLDGGSEIRFSHYEEPYLVKALRENGYELVQG